MKDHSQSESVSHSDPNCSSGLHVVTARIDSPIWNREKLIS